MKFPDLFRSRALAGACVLLLPLFIFPGCTASLRKARHLSRGEDYFKSDDYGKAKIEYLNVLRVDPQNPTAVQRLGTIWYEEGAPLRAFPFLLGSRQLSPDDLDTRTKLGFAFLSVGQVGAARKEALAILQKDPRHGEAALLLADTTANRAELAGNTQLIQGLPDGNSAYLLQAKADLAIRTQDFAAAQDDLERAQAADPKQPSVHLGLATLALGQKDNARAEQEFKLAASLAPARSVASMKYAEYKLGTGAREEAKTLLAETTRRAPDFLPAWQLQARIASAEKNADASLGFLDHIFALDPDNVDARLLQADDLLAKNDSAKAVETLERLAGLYKTLPVVKYQLARAYLRNNNRNQAIVVLTQAVADAPSYTEAILLLGQLHLESGQPQAAVDALTDLLKRHPDLLDAQISLADAYRRLGRLDEAEALLNGLAKSGARDPRAFLLLGMVQRQQNKPADAHASLARARELSPDAPDILFQIVDLDIQQKDYAAAMQVAHDLLQRSPGSAAAHFMEASVFFAQKDWDHAEGALIETLKLDPNLSDASTLLISTYLSANKFPAALAQLDALLAKNPRDPHALLQQAEIASRQNDLPKAREAYEKLLAVNPDSAAALNNLAYLDSENFHQPDKAYDLARRAHSLQPNDASIADTLGWICYQRADYPQALQLCQEAANRMPGEPQIQFHLGMAHYMMGQADAARAALQRAGASPADFPGKATIPGQLALLGTGPGSGPGPSNAELEAAAQSHPGDPVVMLRLGAADEKQQAWDKAAAAYQQALKVNPRLPLAVDHLARLYAGPLHDPVKALGFARTDQELALGDAQVGALLGRLTYQNGNFAQAYARLRDSVRDLPDDLGVRRDFALSAYALGNVDEAREEMQGIVKAGGEGRPETPDARRFLALTDPERTSANPGGLEDLAQQALQADPGDLAARMVIGALQAQWGKTPQAIDTFTGVLQHAPDFAPAQACLAALYLLDPGTRDKAYELAVKARKAEPNDPGVAATLAEATYYRKEYAYSLQLWQESARQRPLAALPLYYEGMCLPQTKQPALARETLTKALSAGLPEPQAGEVKRILADMAARK